MCVPRGKETARKHRCISSSSFVCGLLLFGADCEMRGRHGLQGNGVRRGRGLEGRSGEVRRLEGGMGRIEV